MENFKIATIDYPVSYEKLISLGLIDFECWYILEQDVAEKKYHGLQERYPTRRLIPFAQRIDNDDVACFERGKDNQVFVIHDYASTDWEQREIYADLWAWLAVAVNDMIEWIREEEKFRHSKSE